MISDKQKKILAFPYSEFDAIICDGAVRSGKTSIMSVSFLRWAMDNFSYQRFGFCGKTVDSCWKNLVTPLISLSYIKKRYTIQVRRSEKIIEVRRGKAVNYFEVFGGKDEGSAALIQGRTLAGVLLDEVVLMPESFVNQALARCSVEGARTWFSCNPGPPSHWFKKKWIDRKREHNALYLHFEMTDNPALSEKTLARYRSMYSGVFYERYILGKWVAAEGLVYPMFDEARHVLAAPPETEGEVYVSADYGIQNATVFLVWRREAGTGRWICLAESYYSGRDEKRQKTVAELADSLDALLGGLGAAGGNAARVTPKRVILDPSAAALKVELRRRGYHTQDADNDVSNGINDVCTLLGADRLAFMPCCGNTIKEFGAYLWDAKAADRGEDAPVKENDHAMDAVRYFVRTLRLVQKAGKPEYRPVWMM